MTEFCHIIASAPSGFTLCGMPIRETLTAIVVFTHVDAQPLAGDWLCGQCLSRYEEMVAGLARG